MVRKMIILVAVAVAAMGGTAGAVVSPSPSPSPSHSPSPQAVTQQDRDFLVQAHQSNLTEIESSKAALEKTAGQQGQKVTKTVRKLAKRFVKDHKKLDKAVRRVADQLGVKLPDTPNTEQRKQLDQLSALSGAEFDRAWISAELHGHHETLAAVEQEIENGSSPEVKKLATVAKPIVQEHIDLLLKAERASTPSPSESPGSPEGPGEPEGPGTPESPSPSES
ncbi:DUF4142 domain-containing protein [Streptosporangium sp. CA-115845]|uniref:DUF4142 domain-containing protein n=1 Tax=Streptosporangium sp. CA-115845 TaxID=3240071 RepID=UPI003D90D47B